MVILLIVVGLLVWAGSALLIDAWSRSRRPDLAERLLPYQSLFACREGRAVATRSSTVNPFLRPQDGIEGCGMVLRHAVVPAWRR